MSLVDSESEIRQILTSARRIAVVGLSDKPWRDSYTVSLYMHQQGYEIIPVNPNVREVFGIRSRASLNEVEGKVDIVNVFRRAEHVPVIVDEAIGIGAETIWLQSGIFHEEATRRASLAGLTVVSDRCIRVAYFLLMR